MSIVGASLAKMIFLVAEKISARFFEGDIVDRGMGGKGGKNRFTVSSRAILCLIYLPRKNSIFVREKKD